MKNLVLFTKADKNKLVNKRPKESKFGDYSAFVLLMVSEGLVYVEADMAIRNTTIITETAVEIQHQFEADWFGVEVNQFQQLLAADLRQKGEERRIYMPLYPINNRVNKLVRIRRITPLLSQCQLRFKGGSPGTRLLVEQLQGAAKPRQGGL